MVTKVEYEFDPFDLVNEDKDKLSKRAIKRVLENVSNYVLESVLSDVGSRKSPVTGRPFQKLDSDYQEKKKKEGGTPVPNLELTGNLLDSVKIVKKGEKLTLTVGDDQMGKADGHNNFSGLSPLPERKFIPNDEDNETFRPAIRQGIREIIRDAIDEEGSDASDGEG